MVTFVPHEQHAIDTFNQSNMHIVRPGATTGKITHVLA